MKIYDDSAKVKDLKDACKAVGLNANGKKVDLIERLNEYEVIRSEVEATEARLISENAAGNAGDELDSTDGIVDIPINKTADGDDDDYVPEADDDDDDMEKNANGKRVRPVYLQEGPSVESPEEAEKMLIAEDTWNKRSKPLMTHEGQKWWWMCKKCSKKCYILFHVHDNSVSIWTSSSIHDVDKHAHVPRRRYGLNPITKQQIDLLYEAGTKTASRILTQLRKKKEQYMPKKMLSNYFSKFNLFIFRVFSVLSFVQKTIRTCPIRTT